MTKVALRAYNREIETLIDKGHIDEAVAHCTHILKTFPKHLETYRLLGKAYLEGHRYGEAADIFQRVLLAVPDDFVSHLGMSIISDEQKDLNLAIWHMERAFEINSTNGGIQSELRHLYGRRDGLEPARIHLTRGALAHIYLKGGEFQQALTEIKSVLADDPSRIDMKTLLARAYYRSGMKNQAIEACTELLKLYPYSLDGNRILVETLPGTSMAQSLEQYQRRIRSLDPYAGAATGSVFDTIGVPDEAVMVEKLEWEADQQPNVIAAAPAPTPETSAQPAEEIPDWMRQAGWVASGEKSGQETPPAAEPAELAAATGPELAAAEIPDWLKAMAPPAAAATTDENIEDSEADLDWLASLGAPAAPVESQAPESPAPEAAPAPQEDLEWLNNITLAQPEKTAGEQAAAEIPAWLNNIDTNEKPTEGQAGEVPDWLSSMGTAAAVSAASEEAIPDWVKGHTDESSANLPPETAPAPADGSAPLEEQPAPQEPAAALEPAQPVSEERFETPAVEPETPLETVNIAPTTPPEVVTAAETAASAETAPAAEAPVETPAEADQALAFGWLEGLAGSRAETPVEPANQIEASDQAAAATPAAEEEARIFLESLTRSQDLAAGQEPALEALQPSAEETAPEEMPTTDAAPLAELSEPAQETPAVEEKPAAEIPAAAEGELSALVSGPGTSAADQEDAMAWLESLAQKQGAKPEELLTAPSERSESAPAWVTDLLAQESATQAEPATEIPAQEASLAGEPIAEMPVVEAASALEPTAEIPAEEAALTVEPTAETPVGETASVLEPAAEMPVEETAPALEPTAERPAAETELSALVTGPGISAADQDDAMAWLESLAQKQGAKPEELLTAPSERGETAPAWVTDLLAQESAAPTETTGEITAGESASALEPAAEMPVDESASALEPAAEMPAEEVAPALEPAAEMPAEEAAPAVEPAPEISIEEIAPAIEPAAEMPAKEGAAVETQAEEAPVSEMASEEIDPQLAETRPHRVRPLPESPVEQPAAEAPIAASEEPISEQLLEEPAVEAPVAAAEGLIPEQPLEQPAAEVHAAEAERLAPEQWLEQLEVEVHAAESEGFAPEQPLEQPAAEVPAAEAEGLAPEQPAVEAPLAAAEEPTSERPLVQPVVEEPVKAMEELILEQPVEQPAAEEPAAWLEELTPAEPGTQAVDEVMPQPDLRELGTATAGFAETAAQDEDFDWLGDLSMPEEPTLQASEPTEAVTTPETPTPGTRRMASILPDAPDISLEWLKLPARVSDLLSPQPAEATPPQETSPDQIVSLDAHETAETGLPSPWEQAQEGTSPSPTDEIMEPAPASPSGEAEPAGLESLAWLSEEEPVDDKSRQDAAWLASLGGEKAPETGPARLETQPWEFEDVSAEPAVDQSGQETAPETGSARLEPLPWESEEAPAESAAEKFGQEIDWLAGVGEETAPKTEPAGLETQPWEFEDVSAEPAVDQSGQETAPETGPARLEALPWESEEAPAESVVDKFGQETDWLAGVGEETAATTESAGLEAQPWESKDVNVEPTADQAEQDTAWLAGLGGETAAKTEPAGLETLPWESGGASSEPTADQAGQDAAWLASLGEEAEPQSTEPLPWEPASAIEPAAQAEEDTDWLSSLGGKTEEPTIERMPWELEGEPTAAQPKPESDLSEWLKGLAEPEELGPAPEKSSGWTDQFTEPTRPRASEPEELPDWLKDTPVSEQVAAPEPAPAPLQPPVEMKTAEPIEVTPAEKPEMPKSIPPERSVTAMPSAEKDLPVLEHARDLLAHGNLDGSMGEYSRLIRKGRLLEEIIHDLKEAVYKHPVDVSIWQTLGDANFRSNHLQEALDAYSKAEGLLR